MTLVKLRYPTSFTSAPCTLPCPVSLVQEQSCFSILHHPLKAFLQVQTCHGATGHNVPFVCLDRLEAQALWRLALIGPTTPCHLRGAYIANFVLGHGAGNIALVLEDEQACTRETLRCQSRSIHGVVHTSSCSRPASSWRQSSIRSRSVASTTQMSVSVFSK